MLMTLQTCINKWFTMLSLDMDSFVNNCFTRSKFDLDDILLVVEQVIEEFERLEEMMDVIQRQVDGAVSGMVTEDDARNVSSFVQSVDTDHRVGIVGQLVLLVFETGERSLCLPNYNVVVFKRK